MLALAPALALALALTSSLSAVRLEVADLTRTADSHLSLAGAPAPPLVLSEAEDEAVPGDRQAWAQVSLGRVERIRVFTYHQHGGCAGAAADAQRGRGRGRARRPAGVGAGDPG